MNQKKRQNHKHLPDSGKGLQKNKSFFKSPAEWFSQNKPVLFFLLIFGVLMVGFYIFVGFVPVYNRVVLPAYHHFIAGASARVLLLLGQHAEANGSYIFSPKFSVEIIRGCDAVEATALFTCAVIAFPAGLSRKFVGIIAGVFALAILNLIRIVSLFLIGVHLPSIVDVMHIEVWQGLFIIFAVMLWVVWLVWISRNPAHIKTAITSGPSGS
jgi:exosortase H (IPTLxxWG-CTERM-specific)